MTNGHNVSLRKTRSNTDDILQVQCLEFDVDKLSVSEEIVNMLATMLCLACHIYKAEKDGRDSDKAPLATSTTTVESEGKVSCISNF
jgi:hypothetical protein